ncbi:MAG TPA: inorganic diphosphatase [Candidatus Obscuribacterales bacterium]
MQKNEIKVVIETPRNSRNKYDYDPETGMYECASTLPLGMVFPFDFGFVPSTIGGDGDPIDVLVLMDSPSYPGTLVKVRIIGVLIATQTEKAGNTVRNDRIIGVHTKSIEYAQIQDWKDLSKTLRFQIKHFFEAYNDAKGKSFHPQAWRGIKEAYHLIDKGKVA